MEKLLEKILDIKNIPVKVIFVIWFCCTLILFVPENLLTKLKLTGFLNDFGKYIGISFLISSALLFITFLNYLYSLRDRRILRTRAKKKILEGLATLNIHEQALLREFFIQNKHTLQMPLLDDTVVGLENKSIIYRASSAGPVYGSGVYFSYSITDFARENLTNQLLDLPMKPTEEDKIKIINARPYWARELNRIERWRDASWF